MLKEMLPMNMNLNKKLVVAVILCADYVFIKLLVLNMQLRYLHLLLYSFQNLMLLLLIN